MPTNKDDDDSDTAPPQARAKGSFLDATTAAYAGISVSDLDYLQRTVHLAFIPEDGEEVSEFERLQKAFAEGRKPVINVMADAEADEFAGAFAFKVERRLVDTIKTYEKAGMGLSEDGFQAKLREHGLSSQSVITLVHLDARSFTICSKEDTGKGFSPGFHNPKKALVMQ